MKAFLLEDDLILASEIKLFLHAHQIDCHSISDGHAFLEKAFAETYDIYLLDINVPSINGLDVCKAIRLKDQVTPIIMLSAYEDISDKKEAFIRQADDYLVKPFNLEELLLRIHSRLRLQQTTDTPENNIQIEDLHIYLDDSKVTRNGEDIKLTQKEFQLLTLLAKARGRTLSKQYISDAVWQNNFQTTHNTIEVYINFLRKKIDKNFERKLIHTRPGFGYYLKPE